MKSKGWLLPLLPFLCLCACSRSVLLDAPKAPPVIGGVTVLRTEQGVKCDEAKPADMEELFRILDGAAEMQPGCAGSSLRLAALAGRLLRWMEEYPSGAERAEESLRIWAEKQGSGKLAQIRKTLYLLRECAEKLRTDQIRDLLLDAGYSLSEQGPTREEFEAMAVWLTELIEPVIFKNQRE